MIHNGYQELSSFMLLVAAPLHIAAYLFDNIDIIKCLVNNGADIYMRNDEGKTALDRALPLERYDVIEYLRNRMT